MKVGPTGDAGAYVTYFDWPEWYYPIASIYYGEYVSGFSGYLSNLKAIDAKYIAKARAARFAW